MIGRGNTASTNAYGYASPDQGTLATACDMLRVGDSIESIATDRKLTDPHRASHRTMRTTSYIGLNIDCEVLVRPIEIWEVA